MKWGWLQDLFRFRFSAIAYFPHFSLEVTFWQRAMRPGTAPTSTSVFSLTWTLKMFSPGWRLSIFVWNQYSLFSFFKEDFNRHYLTNKAPYTLAMHTNWFQEENQVLICQKYILVSTPFLRIFSLITLLFSEGCSQWVFGLAGREGRCLLCDRNSGWSLQIPLITIESELKSTNFFSGASLDDRPKAFEPDQVSESYCWQKLKIWFRWKTIIDLKLLFSEVESWKCKTEDELPPPPCPRFVCFLNAFLNWKS